MRVLRQAVLAAAMLVAALSSAQSGAIRPQGATVFVNEVPVVAFQASYSGLPPESRAALMATRIQGSAGSVAVQGTGDIRKILRGPVLLTVVTADDAAASGMSVDSLAYTWSQAIRKALTLPPLKLAEVAAKIPEGETRTFKLVGSKAYAATISSSNYKVASAEKSPEGLLVRAQSQGQASLTVSAGGSSQTLTVDVWPYAANLPQTVTAAVTGMPAGLDTVQGAVEGAVRTQLKTVPGATITFRPSDLPPLEAGASQTVDVKVRVESPRSFPREGTVRVAVRNLPIAKRSEGELWYCNDPESLKMPGALFSAPLLQESPVRLLYHHVNDSTYPLFVRIQLVNNSEKPARVLLMPGDSKPDKNPVLAGLVAADQFVRHWVNNSGEVATIGPHCSMPISLRRLNSGDTMSGLCALRLLAGGPDSLLVRADAIAPFDADARWTAAINSSAPWRYVGAPPVTFYDKEPTVTSAHIYPNPFKVEDVSYMVGGRYGFVRIGQKPISSISQANALDGNFGVVYTIKANMQNPTDTATDVEVVFESSAGYAGALFVVNGQVRRTPPLPPKSEAQLAVVHLEPGASKSLTLITVPHSGGSYPATVTFRPLEMAAKYRATHDGR